MKSTQTLNFVKLATFVVLVVGLSASAFASCGDTLTGMAAAAALRNPSHALMPGSILSGSKNEPDSGNWSVVGLWHLRFVVGDQTIQEAYQIWNQGGTEVHNPNVDPRTGNVCLGVWKTVGKHSYQLAHRVWIYDNQGNFGGTIHLSETIALGSKGQTHNGTFALDFYDPSGTFQFEVAGNVIAERISVD